MDFEPNVELLEEHRRWLANFDLQHCKNWEKILADNAEAAACEALVRRLLEENGNSVRPNEQLNGKHKTPDFLCSQAGKTFFVEVTCISIASAIEKTSLPHPPGIGFQYQGFSGLNDAIFHEVIQKTPQCANQGYPVLVAVGTFHFMASYLCLQNHHIELLLTGQISITQDFETATGTPLGEEYLSTKLYSATFLKPEKRGGMSYARNPVSGIIVCGFGCKPIHAKLALHPKPIHTFDRNLLPGIQCCRQNNTDMANQIITEWI